MSRCTTYKLTCEYEGTFYHGWQRQPHQPTLQATLEEAVALITGEASSVMGAGRTDAGVHAAGQTAHFHLVKRMDAQKLLRGLNAVLPPDIAVTTLAPVEDTFHARFDAVRKTYCYFIYNGPIRSPRMRRTAWFFPGSLHLSQMRAAALHLVGKHDFTSLVASEHEARDCLLDLTSLRITRQGSRSDGALITLTLVASHFLRYLVRNIVGLLVDVGRGRREGSEIPSILAARDRRRAGPTAPPHGLCLMKVDYP